MSVSFRDELPRTTNFILMNSNTTNISPAKLRDTYVQYIINTDIDDSDIDHRGQGPVSFHVVRESFVDRPLARHVFPESL